MTTADLSRLLFEAREAASMYADVVQGQTGRRDAWLDGLVERVDTYRAGRGWSPHGYGGEVDPPEELDLRAQIATDIEAKSYEKGWTPAAIRAFLVAARIARGGQAAQPEV